MYNTSHYAPANHFSRLENIATSAKSYQPVRAFYSSAAPIASPSYQISMSSFVPSIKPSQPAFYSGNSKSYLQNNNSFYQLFQPQQEYFFQPDNFLKPGKGTKFVGKAEEVKEFVEDAFEKIFNCPFPNDIKISVLNKKEFRKIAPSPATIGVSFNRSQQGLLSEIFVLNDTLGRTLLTVGHELGHVLSPTLDNPVDEEAKAYSFSFMWMEIIKRYNIANLGDAVILENPSLNGLHDVAFEFVMEQKNENNGWLEIYQQILGCS